MCDECHLSINEYGNPVFLDSAGRQHCLNGPAEFWRNGTVLYYHHGLLHRDGDLPAVITHKNTIGYWVNGKRHRDGDKPAVIWADGDVEYWVNGTFVKDGCYV